MKKCAYCGHENPEEATHCAGCGTSGFICWEKVSAPKYWLFRFLVAANAGLVVSALAVVVSWLNTREAEGLRFQQYITQSTLRNYDTDVAAYEREVGKPPHQLSDLFEKEESAAPGAVHEIYDGWNRPFLYWTDGTNYLITTYGRDGKPGGEGLDKDLTNRDRQPAGSLPTFRQFVRDCPSGGILSTCAVCGFLTFLVGLITIREPDVSLIVLFKIVATIGGALMIAVILAALHVPTGH